jgi:S-(hydroxymethyl)glutathione dehydrogenase / alcohol dehydrogenase
VITCLSGFCGNCSYCLSGRPALCAQTGLRRGASEPPRLSQDGGVMNQVFSMAGFAEQMLVHEHSLVKVDSDVPFEQLALIGCGVTTGVGAVLNTARIEPGSTVAVIGCGGVGLNCIQGAKIGGAGRIIAIDRVVSKLALAEQFGATDLIDASEVDPVAEVLALTGGGVDYAFEVIGLKVAAEQAFAMLARGGTATIIGMIPVGQKIELDGVKFLGERRIQGSTMGSNRFRIDMPRYITWYRQGKLKLDELVTQRLKLDQINQAFEDMTSGKVARSVIVFD